jgi:ABC-type dipeptide/oligopeptide/nickel transport system ATPase component
MLITHDLGVIAEIADQVIVMYAGQIVEMADVAACLIHHSIPIHKHCLIRCQCWVIKQIALWQ